MQLYLVKMTHPRTVESFYKIGVSQDASNRFKFGKVHVLDSDLSLEDKVERLHRREIYISDHPYNVDDVKVVDFKYEGEARLAERDILQTLKRLQYWPNEKFSGQSECFMAGDEYIYKIIHELEKWMKFLAAKAAAEEPSELKYQLALSRVNADLATKPDDPIELHLKVIGLLRELSPSTQNDEE
ncbi:hypothetical protein Q8W71_30925 [Methylobacterium sp. NEAU 140]|uniref:hypothetical protein n=1 Tax=Methylobacterium sp. NEAU 140 TaxID=3064945 RepID=UPI002732B6AD|nr:hypothetical protein [Methylobacterium sp. NEAU 140]MDP4027006.1 hypothetical protein [Methylobacterium sp. NEAU 140]